MVNIEAAIQWMTDRIGKISYSMTYRNGPNSYDCSSAVSFALRHAGGDLGRIGNTESMFKDLPKAGWVELPAGPNGIDARRGDIFIWGDEGRSAGAFGHTGIFVNENDIVHCNYSFGMSVNNHDYIWKLNGMPTCRIYRFQGATPSSAASAPQAAAIPGRDHMAPRWTVEPGETFTDVMNYYFGEGVWSNDDAKTVASYNGITNINVINVGQVIYIPGPIYWTVEPGDTWAKIAAYYGYADGGKMIQGLNPGPLTVGRKLTIWNKK